MSNVLVARSPAFSHLRVFPSAKERSPSASRTDRPTLVAHDPPRIRARRTVQYALRHRGTPRNIPISEPNPIRRANPPWAVASYSRAHERANARDAPSPWRFLGSRTRVRVRVRTRVRWSFVGAHSTCDAQRGIPCWNLRPEARGLRTRSSPRLALGSWQDGRSPRGVTQSAICHILPFARGPVRLWACFCRPLAERRAPCTVPVSRQIRAS